MKYDAIIVASGLGRRAKLGFNKVLFTMKNGKTVLENSCHLFIEDSDCNKVIVVTREAIQFSSDKVIIVPGGKERYNSVFEGLKKVTSNIVMIHDGVRPFLNKIDLEKLKDAIKKNDGAILAHPAIETVKMIENGVITETIDRDKVYCAMTPQAFKTELILKAYSVVDLKGITDDSTIVEKYGGRIKIVEGSKSNIKLTNREDFEYI